MTIPRAYREVTEFPRRRHPWLAYTAVFAMGAFGAFAMFLTLAFVWGGR